MNINDNKFYIIINNLCTKINKLLIKKKRYFFNNFKNRYEVWKTLSYSST